MKLIDWRPVNTRHRFLHGSVFFDPYRWEERTAVVPLNLFWQLGLAIWWRLGRGARLRREERATRALTKLCGQLDFVIEHAATESLVTITPQTLRHLVEEARRSVEGAEKAKP